MHGLSDSELLFWGGIGMLVAAVVLAIICILIFSLTGKRLKKKLEEEFGKPRRSS